METQLKELQRQSQRTPPKTGLKHQDLIFGILLFIVILLVMPPHQWNSNEEQYLGTAWRRFSPETLTAISALKDTANHRFLYEYLFGFSIVKIGFEKTHMLARLLVTLLYSVSLVYFFRALKFSIIIACTVLLLFIGLGETILGGEWLFKGFEAKTLAYPLVFFSFANSLKKRFTYAYLLLAAATYCHFLVGGFWLLVTFFGQLYVTKNWKQTTLEALKYVLVCLPLFLIIGVDQFQAQSTAYSGIEAYSGVDADWIYTYYRNSHHLAPFVNPGGFKINWYPGIISLIGLTIVSLLLLRNTDAEEKQFTRLILGLNLYLIFALILSYFDKGGTLGKFYLFRPAAMTLFLTLCLYTLVLKNRVKHFNYLSLIVLILAASLVIQGNAAIYNRVEAFVLKGVPAFNVPLGPSSFSNFLKAPAPTPETSVSKKPLTLKQVIQSSNKTDIFLISPDLENNYLSFERVYDRPTLVLYKFIPTKSEDIVRWYDLLQKKIQLFQQGCPSDILQKYPVRYLLAKSNNNNINNCGDIIYEDQTAKLIQLRK